MTIDLNKKRYEKKIKNIKNIISEETGYTSENSNLDSAMNDAINRGIMINNLHESMSEKLAKDGKEPYPCKNVVCEDHESIQNREYCKRGHSCHGCIYQMLDHPPNSLNYDEYMPTHREALDILESLNQLKGDRERYRKENIYYEKASNHDERKNVLLDGVPIYKVKMAVGRVIDEAIKYSEDYNESTEIGELRTYLISGIELEMEKVLGIYPNIKIIV